MSVENILSSSSTWYFIKLYISNFPFAGLKWIFIFATELLNNEPTKNRKKTTIIVFLSFKFSNWKIEEQIIIAKGINIKKWCSENLPEIAIEKIEPINKKNKYKFFVKISFLLKKTIKGKTKKIMAQWYLVKISCFKSKKDRTRT